VSVCHCTDCQRHTGSAFAVVAHFKAENLEITGRPLLTCEYRSLDGLSARRQDLRKGFLAVVVWEILESTPI
jgi:hypothetical protein